MIEWRIAYMIFISITVSSIFSNRAFPESTGRQKLLKFMLKQCAEEKLGVFCDSEPSRCRTDGQKRYRRRVFRRECQKDMTAEIRCERKQSSLLIKSRPFSRYSESPVVIIVQEDENSLWEAPYCTALQCNLAQSQPLTGLERFKCITSTGEEDGVFHSVYDIPLQPYFVTGRFIIEELFAREDLQSPNGFSLVSDEVSAWNCQFLRFEI